MKIIWVESYMKCLFQFRAMALNSHSQFNFKF